MKKRHLEILHEQMSSDLKQLLEAFPALVKREEFHKELEKYPDKLDFKLLESVIKEKIDKKDLDEALATLGSKIEAKLDQKSDKNDLLALETRLKSELKPIVKILENHEKKLLTL